MYINKIFSILEQTHQSTMLELLKDHTPFQQVVATLLSSRTKDLTTIPIVLELFKKYKTPQDFLQIKEEELYGIGFYKVKTKNIHKLSKIIIKKFNNKVPSTFEQLISLPGVGRKTANCVLAYTFGISAIAVDVHVHRISNRLGWVNTNIPEETEEELKKVVDKKNWNKINKLFVSHGQTTCFPIKPNCKDCKISSFCEFVTKK